MQPLGTSYPLPMQSSRQPIERPRTVPANFTPQQHFEEEEEGQITPRPSLTPLGVLAEEAARRSTITRDDTATDLFASRNLVTENTHPQASLYPSSARPVFKDVNFGQRASSASLQTEASHSSASTHPQAQRRIRRGTFRISGNWSYTTTAPPSTDAEAQAQSGRARRYRQKLEQMKNKFIEQGSNTPIIVPESFKPENFNIENFRRTSTPMEGSYQGLTNTTALHQTSSPSSPSKRNVSNVKYNGDVPQKKQRPGLLAGSDRKDTPAPPFGSASRPALSSCPSFRSIEGGEGARKAAALYKTLAEDANGNLYHSTQASEYEENDRTSRRSGLGSLRQAADSGADMSMYQYDRQDTPARDTDPDGDVSMDDVEKERATSVDFVNVLPHEINLQIFELLDASSLASTMRVNKRWRDLSDQTSVWRYAFLRRWNRTIHTDPAPIQVGGSGIGQPNMPNQQWKKMYKAHKQLDANWRKGADVAGKATYLSGHTDSVYCVQFDEEKIITGSRDRTIRVWDMNTMQCTHVIGGPLVRPVPGPKPLRTVDYPSFHSAVASVNGSVYGNSIYKVPSQWHDASILCLQYDDKILVTGSSDSDLLIWDIKTYEPITRLREHKAGVLDVALDGKHIVSCSKDSRIIVWDRDTYEPKGELSGHKGPVNAVQLRGKYLVSASGDGIARLWDIDQMKLVKEFPAKERGLAAVEFSEDMKYVLAGGNDHITYKFETETGREVAQFTGHSQLVRSLWLDSANSRVVSGSYDLDLRVYDFETGDEIWRAEEWTTSWMLAAKSDYRRVVATSQDGRILIIDFGLVKGGINDGMPIDGVDLLRTIPIEKTSAIIFRNPFEVRSEEGTAMTG